VAAVVANTILAQEPGTLYVEQKDLPDAAIYLPAPPDTADQAYADDFLQWQWGKSMRPTARGARAAEEALWGADMLARIHSTTLGLTIDKEKTPALYKLIYRTVYTSDRSAFNAKNKYMRTRPFAQFNEHTWSRYDNEEHLRNNGSYPSGHTTTGWAVALALAEAVPELQESILKRGYEYGESRVIVGVHYQSDVDAGYMCGSAAVARMRVTDDYSADVAAARSEYLRLKGLPAKTPVTVDYPHGELFLPSPVESTGRRYLGDMEYYFMSKAQRGTERGRQAEADCDLSDEALMGGFSDAIGLDINTESTPHIAELVKRASAVLQECAVATGRAAEYRESPVSSLETASEEDRAKGVSCYPSVTAETGWGIALLLVEVAPERQNMILAHGFEMGRSSMILGQSFATDVMAARLMAAASVGRMHSDKELLKLIDKASEEYRKNTEK